MAGKAPKTVALVSLGCPKNLVDSEKILAQLAEAGYVVAAPMDDADVIVINTCGFLSAARDESLDVIGEALEHKRTGRTERVVVAGCLVNRDGRRLYDLAPGIDAIVGVNNRDDIVAAVRGRCRVSKVDPCCGGIAGDAGRFRLTPRHTAYLRIAEGCSQRCTFCTIPAIRGPFRSRPPEQVLAEAAELVADGTVELNIIAQDTTGYGRDLGPRTRPARLLRRLDRLDGVRWIRLMYAYPKRFTDSLIAAIAQCEHVVPYVDIPLQHISDPILRRMGRGITRATTERLLRKIRDRIPDVVIRTALIVGFPGETDRHFEELLHFVREFRFGALGVFPFSPEEGTPAADLPNAVPPEIRRQRAETIMLAQQEIVFAANRGMIGRRIEVLVDGKDARGGCVGRYYGQAPEIDGICRLDEDRPAGSFVRGTVVDSDAYDLLVAPDRESHELEAS